MSPENQVRGGFLNKQMPKQPKSITVAVQIRGGRFVSNQNFIREIMEAFDNQTIDITFKKRTNKRSLQQNAYYWAVIVPIWRNIISEEWGELWDNNQTHEFLKKELNYDEKVIESTGEIVKVTRDTKANTTVQQSDYQRKCCELAFEYFNIEIPPPKKQVSMKFK